MTLLWGGRFNGSMDDVMARLNNSISFDIRLWGADIRGSVAYAAALAEAGILTHDESAQLIQGLQQVYLEFEHNTFAVQPADEDIHTAVERRLKELLGDVAGKLHTGRSRNDQVATDLRLHALDEIAQLQAHLISLQETLLTRAEVHGQTLLPGFTHLQRAQPVTFAHFLLAYFWMFTRDRERLDDCSRRTAVLPLGSGALAGNPFPIDRAALARALGFHDISPNSLDGVSDRDFAAELLFDCALIGTHLSRLAEDLVIYSTSEFGFISFDDAYSTGSSLMPQKKNPDAMELSRGKSGRLLGNLVSLLSMLKGLPMSYDKDLQEDKEPLFDSLDTLALVLPAVAGAVRTLRVNEDRMRADLDPAMLATDVAEYLVRKGLPFRQAHHLSGRAVALAEQHGILLSQLTDSDWQSLSPLLTPDVRNVFNFAKSVDSRDVAGGTSLRAIREQIDLAHQWLTAHPLPEGRNLH